MATASPGSDLLLGLSRVRFAESLGLEPDDWQRSLLATHEPRILLNCSRQSGKSTMAAVIALHRAIYHPGSLVLCLAPSLRQSQELFVKIALFYREHGSSDLGDSERRLSLELTNGSRVITLPGTEKTIRGFSGAALLLVDEASRVPDELYYAIRPMLAVSGGTLIMLSTPWGKRGAFFRAWSGETPEDGDDNPRELSLRENWQRFLVPAIECPRISPTFLREERATLPAWVFRQEYECSFEETEDQVFTHDMISAARDDTINELRFEGDDELWS